MTTGAYKILGSFQCDSALASLLYKLSLLFKTHLEIHLLLVLLG